MAASPWYPLLSSAHSEDEDREEEEVGMEAVGETVTDWGPKMAPDGGWT